MRLIYNNQVHWKRDSIFMEHLLLLPLNIKGENKEKRLGMAIDKLGLRQNGYLQN